MQGSQTLGKTKKKSSQRHSAGNIDYDNITTSQEAEDVPILLHNQHQQHHQQHQQTLPTGFRGRSKTLGDATGMNKDLNLDIQWCPIGRSKVNVSSAETPFVVHVINMSFKKPIANHLS